MLARFSSRSLTRLPRSALLCAGLVAALLALAAGACAGFGVSVGLHSGPLTVDLGYFHDELAPYGDWIWNPPWGWVWQPWGVEPGWVPYSDGRWIYTELGWYWSSSWEWGWAPFHYGRWRCDSRHGWVWIPGTVWAPAWVAWRHGPDWIGWAPLPPEAGWDPHAGLRSPGLEPGPDAWSFVRPHELSDTRVRSRIQPRGRNVTLVDVTREAVAFEPRDGYAVERGLPPEIVERATGRPVQRYQVEDVGPQPKTGRPTVPRDTVPVYRPKVEATRPVEPPPAAGEPSAPTAGPSARQTQQLESWAREEERRLEKVQVQERKQPPAGISVEELKRRQETERKALRDEVEKRQRWTPPERPRPQLKPAPPPTAKQPVAKQPTAKPPTARPTPPAAKPEDVKPPGGEGS